MKKNKKLSLEDMSRKVRNQIFVQSYEKKQLINDVKIVQINRFSGEDGTFEELCRINTDGTLEVFPDFSIRQMSRSKLLPRAIKAWHLHFSQEDVWYVSPEDHMLLGLFDSRGDSTTSGKNMRIVLGAGRSQLVYIPRGVAHGVANISSKEGSIIYFVNQQFSINDPDERRLPWDVLGSDFWIPEKG